MAIDLEGRVIVITGASAGIGAATAVACAEVGMDVVLGARRAERLEAVAERVRAAGRRASLVVGDVTDEENHDRLLDAAAALAGDGTFHAVFANAGYGMDKRVLDATEDEERRMFDVNFFAPVELLRRAARRWRDAGQGGHVLMCSSCVSSFTLPRHGVYGATKAAQHSICAAMRLELRGSGINVSSVHPVTTASEFHDVSADMSGKPRPPTDRITDHTPRMFVQPSERVARAVVRCLRRPRSEVWTSHIVRLVGGAMRASPTFYDLVMKRHA